MDKVSLYQSMILMKMLDRNLVLVTNEGPELNAWLETDKREFVESVRVDTAQILANLGYIVPLSDAEANNAKYPLNTFPWKIRSSNVA